MKFLKTGLSLAVLGATLSVVPGTPSAAVGGIQAADDPGAVARMRDAASGTIRTRADEATGKVGFVRAVGRGADLLPGRAATTPAQAVAKATSYLDQFASAFGARPSELQRDDVKTDRFGTTVTYVQQFQGIPVFAGVLKAHVDAEGDLTSVNGQAVPTDGLSTETRFDAAEAGRRAVAAVKAQPPGHEGDADTTGIAAKAPRLVVYREGLVRGVDGDSDLVYEVEVTNQRNVRDMVFVSATTGKVVNRYSLVHDALDRKLYEESPDTEPVWEEGDPFPGDLNTDQQNLVLSTGESYWFFRNSFGRDSWDGFGGTMRTVNNDPRISCPNANWNGVTTNYCDGVTSDDVVSHEWGHAYTEKTSGLIYQWQPGALNEAYSDIWGETVDLINAREDEEEGDLEIKRRPGTCSTHTAARPLVTINAPSSIAKDCLAGGASFGEQLSTTGITGDVVVAADVAEPAGTLPAGTTTDGCSPYTNAAAAVGKIVMVDRGRCSFLEKAQMATQMQAAALIIGNRDDAPISMSGDAPEVVTTVSIGLADRELIRSATAAGQTVNVTMKDDADERVDSYRWLVGEKSTAFGGAIRDMWNPTCLGDPGKVSDAEYKCSTDDAGGVHSNSGVINRAYALLVDGGNVEGQSLRGIGLTKSAAVFWRTQTTYLNPASDFSDLADGLEAACADMTGKKIFELSTGANDQRPSQEVLTADDCAQLPKVIAATELRLDPTSQCDFKPLLQQGDASPCGEGFETEEVFSEDFEDGVGGWELGGEAVFEGGLTRDWKTDSSAPGTNSTTVAYGPAGDLGECSNQAGDFSSVNWMTSPEITLPEDGERPVMSFRHYVATEFGYDGGNVQVSVGGGAFAPVPAAAFTFNKPTELAPAPGNTNPLAGQPGFTGTDGGKVTGSWGTSVVDLSRARVIPGDKIRVRFAVGRDGCGGVDGWYVDDVVVGTCVEADEPEQPAAVATTTRVQRTWPAQPRKGQDFTVVVKVAAKKGKATGVVALRRGGTVVAQGRLVDGVARIKVKKSFKANAVTMVARYQGTKAFEPSSDSFTVRFKR